MAGITEAIRQEFRKKSVTETGYIKLPDGTVVNNPPAPTQAWTPEEWAAEIKAKEGRIAQLQAQLDSMPKPKDKPDQETLDFYNTHIGQMFDTDAKNQLDIVMAELAVMRKI